MEVRKCERPALHMFKCIVSTHVPKCCNELQRIDLSCALVAWAGKAQLAFELLALSIFAGLGNGALTISYSVVLLRLWDASRPALGRGRHDGGGLWWWESIVLSRKGVVVVNC
jgi:hypothetical protein